MGKALLYRLFGFGKIPPPMVPVLEQEEIVLKEEGLPGSVTFKNFRAPGKRYGFRRSWFMGSMVITRQRVVAFSFSRPIINLPLMPEQIKKLHCTLRGEAILSIAFDAAVFNEEWSGSVEYRFTTSQAGLFLEQLTLEAL